MVKTDDDDEAESTAAVEVAIQVDDDDAVVATESKPREAAGGKADESSARGKPKPCTKLGELTSKTKRESIEIVF